MTDALLLMGLQALVGFGAVIAGVVALALVILLSDTKIGGFICSAALWIVGFFICFVASGILGMSIMEWTGWNPLPHVAQTLRPGP